LAFTISHSVATEQRAGEKLRPTIAASAANVLTPVLTAGSCLLSADHRCFFCSLLPNLFVQYTGKKSLLWTERCL